MMHITQHELEQAERMAAKWEARAEEYWYGGEGWGPGTEGYCKNDDDAHRAHTAASYITEALAKVAAGRADEAAVRIIKAAASARDRLDARI